MKRTALSLLIAITLQQFANAQIITTVAGGGLSRGYQLPGGCPALDADIKAPNSVCKSGNDMYLIQGNTSRILKVDTTTHMSTFFFEQLSSPSSIYPDNLGNIYVAQWGNAFNTIVGSKIKKVNLSTGVITTIAGNDTLGYSGDGGLAINAVLKQPSGVTLDVFGNIYIADQGNNRIRKVAAATGIITTVAGNGTAGYSGDGGLATNAQLNITSYFFDPSGVSVDAFGNIYIADQGNNRIRKVAAATGIITTVAGSGISGYSGDGGLATNAQLNKPNSVFITISGDIYITDQSNNRVRKVTGSTGIITTVAGTGISGHSGDGDSAKNAQLAIPNGVFIDNSGDMYISDAGNARIRKVSIGQQAPCSIDVYTVSTNSKVKVCWTARLQSNPHDFVVQRSIDGLNWQEVGMVTGCNTCNSQITYSLIDELPVWGHSLYRVKQVNFDGSNFTSCNIASVLTVKPPVGDQGIQIKQNYYGSYILSGLSLGMNVELYNMLGQLLKREVATSSSLNIHLHNYAKGWYVVYVREAKFATKIFNLEP